MRVTVAAWIGSANAGDELIFAALRHKLLARGAHVIAVTTHPTADRSTVGHLAPLALTRTIRDSDALVFGGGGLLQDQTSGFNLPYHLSRLALARALGTRRAVVGIGAGPLRTAAGRIQVRRALRGVTAISARDAGSADLLRSLGVTGVRVTADLALSLPSPQIAPADVLCVCLRPWRAARGRLPVGVRARTDVTPEPMVDRLARGLDHAAGALGLSVRLVAMRPGWDDRLHARVAERLAADVELATPPADRVVDVIAASRVVVAMRYHAGIAALLAGRPAVLIGYDPKVTSLAGAMGDGARLLEWTPDDLTSLGSATVAVADGGGAGLAAALAALRAREHGNDAVLDEVLGVAEARR